MTEKLKCQACGVEKDPTVLETYPFPEDGIFDDEPIAPFFELDCQDYDFGKGPFKQVRMCHNCFHKSDPDMWISREGWESLKPIVPFTDLPNLDGDDREPLPQRG